MVYVLFVMGLGISSLTAYPVDGRLFWILTTIATSAYMLSRGIDQGGQQKSRARPARGHRLDSIKEAVVPLLWLLVVLIVIFAVIGGIAASHWLFLILVVAVILALIGFA